MTNLAHKINNYNEAESLAFNLRKLMHQGNTSEAELARQTQIPQPTLHKILAGKTSDPRASTLKSLAGFFGCTIDDLISGSSNYSTGQATDKTQSIPIITWESCLKAQETLATLSPSNWEQWAVSEYVSNSAYALTSKPSMEPKFPKGSVLIIDPETSPEDGDLVIAHFKDTDSATIRELSMDGPIRELSTICKSKNISTNCDENVEILGVVVKSIFTFE